MAQRQTAFEPRSTLSPTQSTRTKDHCAIISWYRSRRLRSSTSREVPQSKSCTLLRFLGFKIQFRFIDRVVDIPVVPQGAVDAPQSSQESPRGSVDDASAEDRAVDVSVVAQGHRRKCWRTGVVHRRIDGNPSCPTENKFSALLRRRSVITRSQVQKTVEGPQVQLKDVAANSLCRKRCRPSSRSRRLLRYHGCSSLRR